MEITFAEVPPAERTVLPVRQKDAHLASFPRHSSSDAATPEDEETDDEAGPAPFSYFPRQKSGSQPLKAPEVQIPRTWPEVDEDTLARIIDRLDGL